MESKETKQKNQTPTKGNQICGFQRKGDKELEEGGQKVKTSSYKLSHRDVMYSMVTIINNTTLYI